MSDDPTPPSGLSRRDFLRGGGAAAALSSAGMLVSDLAEAAKKKPAAPHVPEGMEIFGPGPVPIRLKINGKAFDVRVEPRATLLDVMREELELTGAKRVCDRGTCGACTVLLDGKAVYACSQLAIDVQRMPIQTIEGIGRLADLHPLQAAFVEHDAQQCGFCTPGFIMAAKALLDHNPNPTLPQVQHALSGNFCRCGTYAGMRKAVIAAAAVAVQEDAEEETPRPEMPDGPMKSMKTEAVGEDDDKAARRARRKKKRRQRGGGDGG
jgi:xanthine dehydrogenase YagT iron-sulfur-binding subunit